MIYGLFCFLKEGHELLMTSFYFSSQALEFILAQHPYIEIAGISGQN